MSESIFYHAALALAFGMLAQAVAVRFAIPGIVLLLGTGVVVGPDGLGILDPEAFGVARGDLVALAVTVILFEGGLGLRLEELRRQQKSLTLLLTLGALISMAAGTLAAHWLLAMPWGVASLYGSLMIVTGPTVVTPLLARLTVDRSVRELLIGEGVLIDPIGAIVAIVAVEAVVSGHGVLALGESVIGRLVVGAAVGAVAGAAMAFALRRNWVGEDLRNPVVLASVLAAAALASELYSEAGLMTAVTQGVVMANLGVREMGRLRTFNEEMTIVLLSFVFVFLAADLPMSEVGALGWQALAVIGLLIWVARPLAVLLCTAGSSLTLRERLFVCWICPRGIVAASVAGLFRILLNDAGIPGGNQLEALVFVTVGLTVTVQGLTSGTIARLLGVDVPALRGTVIVGADAFGRLLARLLQAYGRQVVVMDRNHEFCRTARSEGLTVYDGDALSVEALEEAGARYVDTVIAVTTNDELNTLVGDRVRINFRAERVLSLPHAGATADERHPIPFPGNFPGATVVNRLLYTSRMHLVEYEAEADTDAKDKSQRRLVDLPYAMGEFALFLRRRDRVFFASSEQSLIPGDRLLSAVTDGDSGLASVLRVVRQVDLEHPGELISAAESG